ncbi:ROK family protein [Agromyces sp. CFH 90414]|uniref:ROK family protein n=1 Tax=Agromyces agglutinans TaxID=2662258 RepID=A0A6I2F435_9MICO|nr:ROK family protein [Agromyces agglutinans]MRG60245.1 ROK family protein [Agromyces agglutinans]
MKLRTGSKALIREINEALVLDVVRARGPVARAFIAAQTGLSPATVTGITGRLLHAGVLVETDVVRGTGGRPARLLALGREAVFAVGVRLTAREAYVALTDLAGEIVADHREQLASTALADAVDAVVTSVDAVTRRQASGEVVGIGIAVSGVVDQAGGRVRHSGTLGWENVPLRAELARALDAPVVLDSHVNAFASAGLLYDGRLEGRDLIVFSVGQSLGASVVVQGRIHRGFDASAGGFAHWRGVGDADRPCHCGAQGCLETWGSRWGIERELARRGIEAGLDADPGEVEPVLDEAARQLGVAMANASKMFGPEGVIVAFAPELDLERLSRGVEAAFQAEFAHGNTAAPSLDLVIGAEAEVAKGAAYEVLAPFFTAEVAQFDDADAAGALA